MTAAVEPTRPSVQKIVLRILEWLQDKNSLRVVSRTMTAGEEPPSEADAYIWDQSLPLPQDPVRKWQEVAQGIDKSQTGEEMMSLGIHKIPFA
jgi:hypothetical protein